MILLIIDRCLCWKIRMSFEAEKAFHFILKHLIVEIVDAEIEAVIGE